MKGGDESTLAAKGSEGVLQGKGYSYYCLLTTGFERRKMGRQRKP